MTPQDSYTPNEMETIFAKRLVEQNRREREEIIARGFDDLRVRVEKANNLKTEIIRRLEVQDRAIADVKLDVGAVKDQIVGLGVDTLSVQERAALGLMLRKFVLDGEVHTIWNRWTGKVLAIVAIAGPFVAVMLEKIFK